MYVCISIRPAEKTKGISWTATLGFDTVNSDIQCLVIKGYLKLQKARSIVSIKLPQLDSRRIFLIPRSF